MYIHIYTLGILVDELGDGLHLVGHGLLAPLLAGRGLAHWAPQ